MLTLLDRLILKHERRVRQHLHAQKIFDPLGMAETTDDKDYGRIVDFKETGALATGEARLGVLRFRS